MSSESSSTVSGSSLAGLAMQQLPLSSAGATFFANSVSGALKGMMPTMVPMGSRIETSKSFSMPACTPKGMTVPVRLFRAAEIKPST